jgi:serine/threonine protein kinase
MFDYAAAPADVIRTSEFAALSVHDRTTYARQLCDMVLALHGAGIVLVDFKPSNVMIKYSLAAHVPTLKAIDADSWRLAGSPLGSITGGGAPVLPDFTPMYAAVELLRAWRAGRLGTLVAGAEMDLYSLGLFLATLLSAACRPPFEDDGAAEAAAAVNAPPAAAALACGGSDYAREAVAALLAVDPAARAGTSLAGLLEKNKYLNAGAKSTAAHAADELG